MRFLLHDSQAVYNAVTKKWTFSLDRSIANPKQIRVGKCSFTCATSPTYPAVVYMRSNALTEICTIKHTVELKSHNHHDQSNVIAVLHETHTKGRYSGGGISFPTQGHTNKTSIDIYFTDGTTILDGEAAASGSSGGGSNAAITDADIVNVGQDLVLWVDYSDTNNILDSNYAPVSGTAGDSIKYIYNKNPGDANLLFVSQNSTTASAVCELAGLGQGFGMIRTTSVAAWFVVDSSWQNNPTLNDEWTLHHTFKAPNNLNDTGALFHFKYATMFYSGGNFTFWDPAIQNLQLTYIPTRPYLLTLSQKLTGAQNARELHWRLEDLTTNTVQTEVTSTGLTGNTQHNWYISHSGSYFYHVSGPILVHQGIDATTVNNCQSWLKSKYAGEVTSSSSTTATSDPASFFVNLNILQSQKGR